MMVDPQGLVQEGYRSIRQEMVAIIQTRYQVLVMGIVAVSVIVAMGKSQNTTDPVASWVPTVAGAVFIPSLVITIFMTRHFHRLAMFLRVYYEDQDPAPKIETAFNVYSSLFPRYWAYTYPLFVTYSLIVCLLFFLDVWSFWGRVPDIGHVLALVVLVVDVVLCVFLYQTPSARAQFEREWRRVVKKLSQNSNL